MSLSALRSTRTRRPSAAADTSSSVTRSRTGCPASSWGIARTSFTTCPEWRSTRHGRKRCEPWGRCAMTKDDEDYESKSTPKALPERDANARLIASAPRLLEALETLLQADAAVKEQFEEIRDWPWRLQKPRVEAMNALVDMAMIAARGAITNARGEQA